MFKLKSMKDAKIEIRCTTYDEAYLEIYNDDTHVYVDVEYDVMDVTDDDFRLITRVKSSVHFIDNVETEYVLNAEMFALIHSTIYDEVYEYWHGPHLDSEADFNDDWIYEQNKMKRYD